jgi:hypothetical protein
VSDFTTQPNCRGIDVDGVHYPSNGHGHVTVDNPKHADLIASSFERGTGYLEQRVNTFANAGGKTCVSDGFVAFTWQDRCPRCGGTEWNEQPTTALSGAREMH